mgnify:CR=1 FL=1
MLDQSENEHKKKLELSFRGSQLISKIKLERLENTVNSRNGGVVAAKAHIASVIAQKESVITSQLATQVIGVGSLAEVVCLSRPFEVITMVVTRVQPVVAAGQLRPSDSLLDAQERARPGTLTVVMEPLQEGDTPGSKCIANAYTNKHDLLASGDIGVLVTLFYHPVDAAGVVHAIFLRIQALVMRVKMLVFAGH